MIIGGGKISYYLAKKINDVGVSCKIIEKNIFLILIVIILI